MPPARSEPGPLLEADAEPIPRYRLVERLGGGGFGEVWRCIAPGGLAKAIKFVRGGESDPDQVDLVQANPGFTQEWDAFEKVKAVRHPYLLGLDRVEVRGPDLLMVMELADKTLQDRLAESTAAGFVGIPADEFFPLALEAAEALDVLTAHGLQHLDVKPANLFLVGGHLKVGDFSLVASIGADRPPATDSLAGITPKYVAPEVLRGTVAAASDQYSLALVVYELLTGRFPYPVDSARRVVVMHVSGTPDLSGVTPAEAAVLGRALAKQPDDRFPSCREFIRTIIHARSPTGVAPVVVPTGSGTVISPPRADTPAGGPGSPDAGTVEAAALTHPDPSVADGLPVIRVFNDLGRAGEAVPDGQSAEELVRTMIRVCLLGATEVPAADGADVTDLFCRFPVQTGRSELTEKLQAFSERWQATTVMVKGGACTLSVVPQLGWFRRLFEQPEPIELVIALPSRRVQGRGEITAVALGCSGRGDPRRHAFAVEMLADLRESLADEHEYRRSVRYPVETPVVLYPVGSGGRVGPGVEARCIDLSMGGARVESVVDPRADQFYLRFPAHPVSPRCGLLCAVVRRVELGPDHFQFGCRFVPG